MDQPKKAIKWIVLPAGKDEKNLYLSIIPSLTATIEANCTTVGSCGFGDWPKYVEDMFTKGLRLSFKVNGVTVQGNDGKPLESVRFPACGTLDASEWWKHIFPADTPLEPEQVDAQERLEGAADISNSAIARVWVNSYPTARLGRMITDKYLKMNRLAAARSADEHDYLGDPHIRAGGGEGTDHGGQRNLLEDFNIYAKDDLSNVDLKPEESVAADWRSAMLSQARERASDADGQSAWDSLAADESVHAPRFYARLGAAPNPSNVLEPRLSKEVVGLLREFDEQDPNALRAGNTFERAASVKPSNSKEDILRFLLFHRMEHHPAEETDIRMMADATGQPEKPTFGQLLTMVFNEPLLLRDLRLVFDYSLPIPANMPEEGVIEVSTDFATGDDVGFEFWKTAFSFDCANDLFVARPYEPGRHIKQGLLDLSFSDHSDQRKFGLTDLNVEGAVHQLVTRSENLAQEKKFRAADTPESRPLPALGGNGISLTWKDRALDEKLSGAKGEGFLNLSVDKTLYAEQVTAGFRADIGVQSGDAIRWHSLHQRTADYKLYDLETRDALPGKNFNPQACYPSDRFMAVRSEGSIDVAVTVKPGTPNQTRGRAGEHAVPERLQANAVERFVVKKFERSMMGSAPAHAAMMAGETAGSPAEAISDRDKEYKELFQQFSQTVGAARVAFAAREGARAGGQEAPGSHGGQEARWIATLVKNYVRNPRHPQPINLALRSGAHHGGVSGAESALSDVKPAAVVDTVKNLATKAMFDLGLNQRDGAIAFVRGESGGMPEEFELPENLFQWNNWSLSAPNPAEEGFKKTGKINSFAVNEAETERHKKDRNDYRVLSVQGEFEAANGSLPAMRYGGKYWARCRLVDLAGNSHPVRSNQAGLSGILEHAQFRVGDPNRAAPFVYCRHDPINPPDILLFDQDINVNTTPGEQTDRLVVRADNIMGNSVSTRVLVPPKSNLKMAELHGHLNSGLGRAKIGAFPFAYMTECGTFPTWREIGTLHLGKKTGCDKKSVEYGKLQQRGNEGAVFKFLPPTRGEHDHNRPIAPYLPDPLAQRVVMEIYDHMGRRIPCPALSSAALHFYDTDKWSWPNARPMLLQLTKGPDTMKCPVECTVNPARKQLLRNAGEEAGQDIELICIDLKVRPGAVITLKMSCLPYDQRTEDNLLAKARCHIDQIARIVRTKTAQPDYDLSIGDLILEKAPPHASFRMLLDSLDGPGASQLAASPVDGNRTELEAAASAFLGLIKGRNWLMSPPVEATLIHATPLPVKAPRWQGPLGAPKIALGETSSQLHTEVNIDPLSTSQIEIEAIWDERVDEPQRRKHQNGTSNSLEENQGIFVEQRGQSVVQKPIHPGDSPHVIFQKVQHQFNDTKFRRVSYRAKATSAFEEYFQYRDCFDDKKTPESFARLSEDSQLITILNSSRPKPPVIDMVLPLFGAEIRRTRDEVRSQSPGGGLRIYLNRPWFSSGDGEKLAVVLAKTPSRERGSRFRRFLNKSSVLDTNERVLPFITRWGRDPIWDSNPVSYLPTMADFTSGSLPETDEPLSLAAFDYEMDKTRRNSSQKAEKAPHELEKYSVNCLTFEPLYHTDRQKWYCDIHMDVNKSYFPFVRLALARYQENSMPGAHLSPVVLADFHQLRPDRLVTIQYHQPKMQQVTISVTGYTHVQSVAGRLGNEFRFVVQQVSEDKIEEVIMDTGEASSQEQAVSVIQPDGCFKCSVTARLVPGPRFKYRVLILESELHRHEIRSETAGADSDPRAGTVQRVIYSQLIDY